jgi:adenosylmethionine-8-amino-7-oxononanoate aminotransferase
VFIKEDWWSTNLLSWQDLAKELIDMFKPVRMGKVFFCNSGSDANDTQVGALPH